MTDQPEQGNDEFEQELNEVAEKLNIDLDWARQLRRDEILWLLDHCPFLQIVNPDMAFVPVDEGLQVITAKSSGWDVHVYPDAMASSPGRFIFGGGYFTGGDDESSGGANPGKGTIKNQTIMTAMEMVDIAAAAGWKNIQVVDGHPHMIRGAWLKALELGIGVSGFEPGTEDYRVLARVRRSDSAEHSLRESIKKRSIR